MGAANTVFMLAAFDRRGAGTNAERRAANALAIELDGPHRQTTIETFRCRPNWALAQAWHTALTIAGSLVSVASPAAGIAIVASALLALVIDALTGVSPGRRLTRERASQNVVSRAAGKRPPATLIVTANYDAGRVGLVYRPPPRRAAVLSRRPLGGRAPGWLGWLAIAFAWTLATLIVRSRSAGSPGLALDILQLLPTAGLVLALAALLELAASPFGPAAGDNATGVAVAIALARALDLSPPQNVAVEIVLQGAGDGAMAGLRHHLRTHHLRTHDLRTHDLRTHPLRNRPTASTQITVLGLASCGAGRPRWWTSDGPLVPVGSSRALQRLAATGGEGTPGQASAHRGRGTSPAYPAMLKRLPAITIGCLDRHGLAPRSHQLSDTADAIDRVAIDRTLELALTLVDAVNNQVADVPDRAVATAT